MLSTLIPVVVFAAAAVLEVAGDAVIRAGLRGKGIAVIALGFVVLGSYGVVVNLLRIDFSRLLGAYVGIFAVVSVLVGRFFFGDQVLASTWLGLLVVLVSVSSQELGRLVCRGRRSARSAPPARVYRGAVLGSAFLWWTLGAAHWHSP